MKPEPAPAIYTGFRTPPCDSSCLGLALLEDAAVEVRDRRDPQPTSWGQDPTHDEIIDQVLRALNAANAQPATCWYATPYGPGGEGELARIELQHLTDEAARDAGLLD